MLFLTFYKSMKRKIVSLFIQIKQTVLVNFNFFKFNDYYYFIILIENEFTSDFGNYRIKMTEHDKKHDLPSKINEKTVGKFSKF